jgi:tetratricopeptide (TPR) repeat protein
MTQALRRTIPPLLLVGAPLALYGAFLGSPIFFDDAGVVDVDLPAYRDLANIGNLRWLPVASFGWIRDLLGHAVEWQRAANLLIHTLTSLLLFGFLTRLFGTTIPSAADSARTLQPLSPSWLAFFGALLFAVHPAATYAVAYLVQRTILLAALFSILSWWLLFEGLKRDNRRLLLLSSLACLLAVHSKEHALLAPLVSGALVVLAGKVDRPTVWRLLPVFFLYGLASLYALVALKAGGVVTPGSAYEPNAEEMLGSLGVAREEAFPLSVVTQCFLFFRYVLLWVLPNPQWMSISMEEPLARTLLAWPQAAGVPAYAIWVGVAAALLLRRGTTALLGLGMLAPAMLFVVELSVARVQEVFVLYRSYLWMPLFASALPFCMRRVPGRVALPLLLIAVGALSAVTVERLKVFSDPARLWEDASAKASGTPNRLGYARILFHRGKAYVAAGRYEEALQDLSVSLSIRPGIVAAYYYRGVALQETGRYADALADFDTMVRADPEYGRAHYGRGRALEALGKLDAARSAYAEGCARRIRVACVRARELGG